MTPRRLLALAALLLTLTGCGITTGTVTAKVLVPETYYSCQVGSVPVGNVSVPVMGTCYAPPCWRLDLVDGDAHGSVCTTQDAWDRTAIGQTWGAPVIATVQPRVQLVAKTEFFPPADVPWSTDVGGGQALAELAGRACYESWSKPNPATATNAGYLTHILEVGHLSVLEHGTVSFYLTGLSRSLTHELIRHRHFSYSQLSQRYVPETNAAMVVPDVIADDPELHAMFEHAAHEALSAYSGLLHSLEAKYATEPNPTLRRKLARQAARAILPNATETRIVVTGNYRAWRHFIALRANEHADIEIRALAIAVLRQLQDAAPNVFADWTIHALADGTEIAKNPHAANDAR